jgi:hypothetical protein
MNRHQHQQQKGSRLAAGQAVQQRLLRQRNLRPQAGVHLLLLLLLLLVASVGRQHPSRQHLSSSSSGRAAAAAAAVGRC